MSEPQLSVRSGKARDLAHALAKRTGQPIDKLAERALERYDQELRQQQAHTPVVALLRRSISSLARTRSNVAQICRPSFLATRTT